MATVRIPSAFLQLARELRDMIYHDAWNSTTVIGTPPESIPPHHLTNLNLAEKHRLLVEWQPPPNRGTCFGLMYSCRQVYTEMLESIERHDGISFELDLIAFKKSSADEHDGRKVKYPKESETSFDWWNIQSDDRPAALPRYLLSLVANFLLHGPLSLHRAQPSLSGGSSSTWNIDTLSIEIISGRRTYTNPYDGQMHTVPSWVVDDTEQALETHVMAMLYSSGALSGLVRAVRLLTDADEEFLAALGVGESLQANSRATAYLGSRFKAKYGSFDEYMEELRSTRRDVFLDRAPLIDCHQGVNTEATGSSLDPPLFSNPMLVNADIIYLISRELDPAKVERHDRALYDARTARITLLSLGLTNKICLEPALDVLWKEIHSMDALRYFLQRTKDLGKRARVLESMRNLLSKPRGDNQKVIVKGRIRWNRMLYYTSRVRVLSLDRPDHVGASIYARIGEAPQCIFPNLRKLCASQLLISSGSLPFFLSDSLLSVEFPSCYGEDAPDLGPSLSSVARKVPTLEEIILSQMDPSREFIVSGRYWTLPLSSFSSTLRTLEGLRILRIYHTLNHYDEDFIATISNLPKLSDLSLRVPSTTHLNYNGIRKSGFASLKHFSIGASIDEAHTFLSKIPSMVLRSLEVTTLTDPDFFDLPALLFSFNRLALKISTFSLLTRCCIELSCGTTILLASDDDLWAVFTSFLPLHEMQVFEYTFPMCLSDERIESFTLAWP
ncbi:hypothetical protein BT96DRAFT_1018957 [Gymnopus androsaceus JB14]|uniref:Uncharacterized protein n=1 Tax=Gymnopus androsaceus JB14 TaxID=1447944 RepID=A0A6A4HMU0_9AGAR|nr:hypothetical protein BT96DRAFT_1018957 [Gymnopus androsaceus JB14]